jgi:transcriptional regulator with XRE-family HTH domain
MFKDRFKYVFLDSPGLKQVDLAKKTGLPVSLINHIACGRRKPSLQNLQKLLKVLRKIMLRPYYLRLLAYLLRKTDEKC